MYLIVSPNVLLRFLMLSGVNSKSRRKSRCAITCTTWRSLQSITSVHNKWRCLQSGVVNLKYKSSFYFWNNALAMAEPKFPRAGANSLGCANLLFDQFYQKSAWKWRQFEISFRNFNQIWLSWKNRKVQKICNKTDFYRRQFFLI